MGFCLIYRYYLGRGWHAIVLAPPCLTGFTLFAVRLIKVLRLFFGWVFCIISPWASGSPYLLINHETMKGAATHGKVVAQWYNSRLRNLISKVRIPLNTGTGRVKCRMNVLGWFVIPFFLFWQLPTGLPCLHLGSWKYTSGKSLASCVNQRSPLWLARHTILGKMVNCSKVNHWDLPKGLLVNEVIKKPTGT